MITNLYKSPRFRSPSPWSLAHHSRQPKKIVDTDDRWLVVYAKEQFRIIYNTAA